MTPIRPARWRRVRALLATCLWLGALCPLSACYQDDGGARVRALEMQRLAHESFAQAGGRCDDPTECAQKEAGFAYAKRARIADPDDCPRKGDEDFIDGCQQYGYAIDAALRRKGF